MSTPDICLSSPDDVLSAIPYLLGHTPSDSFVMVGLHDGRVHMTARLDLPPVHQPVSIEPISLQHMRTNGVNAVVLVGYGPANRVTRMIDHVIAEYDAAGIRILEALRVTDGRYWSYTCTQADCCPIEGKVTTASPAVQATFVSAGMSTLPNRAAVTDQLAPAPAADREDVAAHLRLLNDGDAHSHLSMLARDYVVQLRQVTTRASAGDMPDLDVTAEVAFSLLSPRVLAEAMVLVDVSEDHATIGLWTWLVRHVEGIYQAHAAALLAFAAWRSGNGVLAVDALTIADATGFDSRLGALMHRALVDARPPGSVPKLSRAVIDSDVA